MGDVTDLPLSETAKRRVRRARAAEAGSGRWVSNAEMARLMVAITRATLAGVGIEPGPILRIAGS